MTVGYDLARYIGGHLNPLSDRPPSEFHGAALSGDLSASGRQARVFLPALPSSNESVPVIVILHGAGGDDGGLVEAALRWAEENSVCALVPTSAGSTWDILRGGYGPDVCFIELLLKWAGQYRNLDPTHVALAGFSDGASYALSLGAKNPEVFTDIMAFSPGFALTEPGGPARIFISHGAHDHILSVECGRGLAARFTRAGNDVQYAEFDGDHRVPEEIAVSAFTRFLTANRRW
jgi:phospholipase/carboxylesterase